MYQRTGKPRHHEQDCADARVVLGGRFATEDGDLVRVRALELR